MFEFTANNSFESLYKPTVVMKVLGSLSNDDSTNELSEPLTNVGLLEVKFSVCFLTK